MTCILAAQTAGRTRSTWFVSLSRAIPLSDPPQQLQMEALVRDVKPGDRRFFMCKHPLFSLTGTTQRPSSFWAWDPTRGPGVSRYVRWDGPNHALTDPGISQLCNPLTALTIVERSSPEISSSTMCSLSRCHFIRNSLVLESSQTTHRADTCQ